MRFTQFFAIALLIPATALAAPVPAPGIGDLFRSAKEALGSKLSGGEGNFSQRRKIIGGMSDTMKAIEEIIDEAPDNVELITAANEARTSLIGVGNAIKRIQGAISTKNQANPEDQTTVAEGIAAAEVTIQGLNTLIGSDDDDDVFEEVSKAQQGIVKLRKAADEVLAESGFDAGSVGAPVDDGFADDEVVDDEIVDDEVVDDEVVDDEVVDDEVVDDEVVDEEVVDDGLAEDEVV